MAADKRPGPEDYRHVGPVYIKKSWLLSFFAILSVSILLILGPPANPFFPVNTNHGQGQRTDPESGVVSAGRFADGKLEGNGEERATDGTLLREGVYSNGLLQGAGKAYSERGALLYEGSFQNGLYHGQGRWYDAETSALLIEGTFVNGISLGLGTLYHPSGQALYQGQIYDGRPRADSFLGLSLTEVEAAFSEHWLLYTNDSITAFVYPTFDLMFITRSDVGVLLPTEWETGAQAAAKSPEWGSQRELLAAINRLAAQTVKSDIIICEVLSYGRELPGVAQPAVPQGAPDVQTASAWRGQFSDYALGQRAQGDVLQHKNGFAFRFSLPQAGEKNAVEHSAQDGGVQSVTAWRSDESQSFWYQSALRKEGDP